MREGLLDLQFHIWNRIGFTKPADLSVSYGLAILSEHRAVLGCAIRVMSLKRPRVNRSWSRRVLLQNESDTGEEKCLPETSQ